MLERLSVEGGDCTDKVTILGISAIALAVINQCPSLEKLELRKPMVTH
jgi:hypothetical protein